MGFVLELKEAFAAQALAAMPDLELDLARINPLCGAIPSGRPGRSAPPRWGMACSAAVAAVGPGLRLVESGA